MNQRSNNPFILPGSGGTGWAAQFALNNVINMGMSEVIRQRYYDRLLYPTAGVQNLNFFQAGIGSGITSALGATVGTAKTYQDTNMEGSGGMVPNGKQFLIESIEIIFEPGSVSTANTFLPALTGNFDATAADAAYAAVNDVTTFYAAGLFNFNILAKNYLTEYVSAFPQKTGLDVSAAISSNGAATGTNVIQYAKNSGRPYFLDPMLTLQPMVQFLATILYPAVVATPSGFNGRVTCILDGVLMRAAQ